MRKLLEKLFEVDTAGEFVSIFEKADQAGGLDQVAVNKILAGLCKKVEENQILIKEMKVLEEGKDKNVYGEIDELRKKIKANEELLNEVANKSKPTKAKKNK